MTTPSDGKNEFKDIIKYININKIDLNKIAKDNISKLILQWNLKNKKYDDYSKIEEYNNITFNSELDEIWTNYTKILQKYRFNLPYNSTSPKEVYIRVFIDDEAKNEFLKIIEGKSMITNQTINENEHIKLITATFENTITAYALLSKNDYDPYGKYTNPYTLDYIYSLKEHRRRGFASIILDSILNNEQITAYCDNKESEELFKQAGFKYYGLDKILRMIPVYRCF